MITTPQDPYLGRAFGPYVVQGKLGEGSSGQVYRARHRNLDRDAALKLLAPPEDAPEQALARFRKEARAAARLQDHRVAQIYDFGQEGGVSWIAQELVEGRALDARLEEAGKLPLEEALGIGVDLAGGLEVIHKAGLVHRDLSPKNVVLTEGGAAKIVDFGLVRILDDSVNMTKPRAILGTPLYMAPEQIEVTGEIGPEADVFALACVLARALTGVAPHDTGEESLRAFLARRMRDEVTDLRARRPDLPAGVAQILQQALATEPGRRPTARAVHASLLDARRALRTGTAPISQDMPTQPLTPVARTRASVTPPSGARRAAATVALEPPTRLPEPAQPQPAALERLLMERPWLSGAVIAAAGLLVLALAWGFSSKPSTPGSPPPSDSLGDLGVLGGSNPEPTAKDAKDAKGGSTPTPPRAPADPLPAALDAIAVLQLDRAERLLADAGDSPDAAAAHELIGILRQLNGAAPLQEPPEDARMTVDAAPRVQRLVMTWEPALNTYARARAAAEQRNMLGIVFAFQRHRNLRDKLGIEGDEPLGFLRPERRCEFALLEQLNEVGRYARRNKPRASKALTRILEDPALDSELCRSLTPWLKQMRQGLGRRGFRRQQ